MKGIIIYEDYRGKDVVEAIKLGAVNYDECKSDTSDGSWINILSGIKKESTQAYCNEEDAYDFETGALIALMKMCGRDKVIKACDELYKDDNNEKLIEENNHLKYIKSCNESTIKSLEDTNETLKKEKEQIIVAKNVLYNKLEKERDLLMVENDRRLKDKIDLKEKYVALKAENEKLKLDCEKLQHGYLDTDMIFCGGRQNGKQYKALVELFKKIPKEKVQAAYIVAYKESLIWCTSQPSIRDSLDKLNEPISKLTVDSLIEQSRAFTQKCIDEWLYRPPTKREEMWDKIFALHKKEDIIIKVKREDVNTFLHEIENKIPEITWASGVKIFETKYTIGDIYEALKTCDVGYFRLRKETTLSYSCDEFTYAFKGFKYIDYLPPMRWDLFKKGRIVVGVKNNKELEEFRKEVEINTGIKDIPICPTNLCLFYSFDKDNYKIILETIEKPNIAKINHHKVVYWEDVR